LKDRNLPVLVKSRSGEAIAPALWEAKHTIQSLSFAAAERVKESISNKLRRRLEAPVALTIGWPES
jgi:hypothetical protein